MFYALATDHDYWEKRLNLFVALAPVVHLGNTDSIFIKMVSRMDGFASWLFSKWSIGEVFKKGTVKDHGGLCRFIPFCSTIAGFLDSVLNPAEDPGITLVSSAHFPNGASIQQLVHYGQLVKSGEFRYFDYGKKGNYEHYRDKVPPLIDISEITEVPIAMFVNKQDTLANIYDNRWLKDQLQSLVHYQESDGGHASFVIGADMSYFKTVLELV